MDVSFLQFPLRLTGIWDVYSVVFNGITGPLAAHNGAVSISCVLYLAKRACAVTQDAGTGLLLVLWP